MQVYQVMAAGGWAAFQVHTMASSIGLTLFTMSLLFTGCHAVTMPDVREMPIMIHDGDPAGPVKWAVCSKGIISAEQVERAAEFDVSFDLRMKEWTSKDGECPDKALAIFSLGNLSGFASPAVFSLCMQKQIAVCFSRTLTSKMVCVRSAPDAMILRATYKLSLEVRTASVHVSSSPLVAWEPSEKVALSPGVEQPYGIGEKT